MRSEPAGLTQRPLGSGPDTVADRAGPVLRVAQIVTTLARGGAQATVLASLPRAGHEVEVTVLAGPDDPGEGTYWSETDWNGSDWVAGRVVVVPPLHRRLRPAADVWALVWLIRWLSANRPDVVHTHSTKAGVLGRLAAAVVGIPAVHTVHGWSFAATSTAASGVAPARAGPLSRWGLDRPAMARLMVVRVERLLARVCRALVVVTPLDAETGLGQGIGRPGAYRLIRSGIDLDEPRAGAAGRDRLRAGLGWDGAFVVGTVARLAPQKDLATLIDGFARAELASGLLVIVGAGPEDGALRQQVGALGLEDRVRFLGHRSDAARLSAGFDVFALTSRWEGLPRAMVEAAAAGVPVVATPVGGVTELIRTGATGTLVPVADREALARALEAVAGEPERHRAMAARAAEATAAFSDEVMRRDLVQLWRDAAGWC